MGTKRDMIFRAVYLVAALLVVAITFVATSETAPCAFCGAESHAVRHCAAQAVENGAVGRWAIPDVGVNVACYGSTKQDVCDAKDSACYFALGSQTVIGDHWHQGFNAIKRCKVGMKAYLDAGDGVQEYVCTSIIKGYNTGATLTDEAGNSINERNPGGITCYTCSIWSQERVTIAFFEPSSR